MWGFVRKLASTVPQYVEARRRRCEACKEDPAAYGAGFAPNPPHRHGHGGCDVSEAAGAGGGAPGARADAYKPRRGGARRVAAVALVGALALVAGARRTGGAVKQRRRAEQPLLAAEREAGAVACE